MAFARGDIAPELEFAQLEIEAKARARTYVANILQTPDKLEKVEQFRKSISKKKASVEAQLKTSIQSQLDGVRTGLNQLQNALQDIKEIKSSLLDCDEACYSVRYLNEKLKDLRQENAKHRQLGAAVENLNHIFSVPETVKKCREHIKEDRLLNAHKCLMDLENSRDDLLYELHKSPNPNSSDQQTILQYYREVEKLSEELGKKIMVILKRTTTTAPREPTIIVSALRIIEREEKIDDRCKRRYDNEEFLPPGRPKRWRKKAFDSLEEVVREKVECNQMEEREQDKMWLVRHLEVTRRLVVDDLRVVKTQCDALFPPHWGIVKKYIEMYHNAISQHLIDIIHQGLEGNELVTLLTWVEEYTSEELMGNPQLQISPANLPPLLEESTIQELQKRYFDQLQNNLQNWMKNSLDREVKDWYREQEPDCDGKGYFLTSMSAIIFDMIHQNITVAASIKADMTQYVIVICMDEIANFAKFYKAQLECFKEKHMGNRAEPVFYIHYMVACINNCAIFAEQTVKLSEAYDENAKAQAASIASSFRSVGMDTAVGLLDEVFMDLKPQFDQLITRKWYLNSVQVDTICITLEDYHQDYLHLRPEYLAHLIKTAQNRILQEYVKALVGKRIEFKNYAERVPAGDQIIKEADQLTSLFQKKLLPWSKDGESPFQLLKLIAEMIRLRDTTVMVLEISTIGAQHPEITVEHLVNVLLMREDVNRSQARTMVNDILGIQSNA